MVEFELSRPPGPMENGFRESSLSETLLHISKGLQIDNHLKDLQQMQKIFKKEINSPHGEESWQQSRRSMVL